MSNLYNQLRELRRKLAEQEAVEVFRVFQNGTIDEICIKKPKNLEELLEVKGMGEKKVKRYGQAILKLVNEAESNEGREISNSQFPISNENAEDTTLPSLSYSRRGINADRGDSDLKVSSGSSPSKQTVSVSQYLEYLNLVLQKTADVKVVGEVSGSKMYPSGFYFTLKDKADESALSCYLPTYTYRGLGIPIEDGMEVSVEGMPRLVKRNGRFQFTVESVALVGEGALKKAYDLLKAKFEQEGLFARKRALPEFVTSVGVITSRAGAVIHDFRNNLAKLGIKVYLKDVRVEGASSPGMIVSAVKWFNQNPYKDKGVDSGQPSQSFVASGMTRPDIIIIMRGGGSMEDLQGFNNEQVVRAVFGSKIPTIVSIGHDKDVPLAQLAADVMVSTPTAAAHAVSGTWSRLVEDLPAIQSRLFFAYAENKSRVDSRFAVIVSSLSSLSSRLSQSYRRWRESLLNHANQYIQWIFEQRKSLIGQIGQIGQMQTAAHSLLLTKVLAASAVLEQANPERQLRLGYAIVKNQKGKVIRLVEDVGSGEELDTQLSNGSIKSIVK